MIFLIRWNQHGVNTCDPIFVSYRIVWRLGENPFHMYTQRLSFSCSLWCSWVLFEMFWSLLAGRCTYQLRFPAIRRRLQWPCIVSREVLLVMAFTKEENNQLLCARLPKSFPFRAVCLRFTEEHCQEQVFMFKFGSARPNPYVGTIISHPFYFFMCSASSESRPVFRAYF